MWPLLTNFSLGIRIRDFFFSVGFYFWNIFIWAFLVVDRNTKFMINRFQITSPFCRACSPNIKEIVVVKYKGKTGKKKKKTYFNLSDFWFNRHLTTGYLLVNSYEMLRYYLTYTTFVVKGGKKKWWEGTLTVKKVSCLTFSHTI